MNEIDIEKIKEAYINYNISIKKLSEYFNVTYYQMHYLLEKNNIKKNINKPKFDILKADLIKLRNENKNYEEISKIYNVSIQTIYRYCKKYNLIKKRGKYYNKNERQKIQQNKEFMKKVFNLQIKSQQTFKYHSDKYRNSSLKVSFEDCLDYLNEKLIDYCLDEERLYFLNNGGLTWWTKQNLKYFIINERKKKTIDITKIEREMK